MYQPQEAPQQGQAGVHRQADGDTIVLHHLHHRVADGLPVLLAEDHNLRHVKRLHFLQLPGQRRIGLDTLLQMVTIFYYTLPNETEYTPSDGKTTLYYLNM